MKLLSISTTVIALSALAVPAYQQATEHFVESGNDEEHHEAHQEHAEHDGEHDGGGDDRAQTNAGSNAADVIAMVKEKVESINQERIASAGHGLRCHLRRL